MLRYLELFFVICLSVIAINATSVIDNPPDPKDFPECPQADIRSFQRYNTTIDVWFSSKDPTGILKLRVFPTGLPKTRDEFNNPISNPKNVYTAWYASWHAVGTASKLQIEEETRKREDAEKLAQQASAESEQLQKQLKVAEEKTNKAEAKASESEKKAQDTEQNLQLAQQDALVAHGLNASIATEATEMLNDPDYVNHTFLYNDINSTITLKVEKKDSSQLEKKWGFPPENYVNAEAAFHAMDDRHKIRKNLTDTRPKYQIVLTPRPPKQEGEPPALTS